MYLALSLAMSPSSHGADFSKSHNPSSPRLPLFISPGFTHHFACSSGNFSTLDCSVQTFLVNFPQNFNLVFNLASSWLLCDLYNAVYWAAAVCLNTFYFFPKVHIATLSSLSLSWVDRLNIGFAIEFYPNKKKYYSYSIRRLMFTYFYYYELLFAGNKKR